MSIKRYVKGKQKRIKKKYSKNIKSNSVRRIKSRRVTAGHGAPVIRFQYYNKFGILVGRWRKGGKFIKFNKSFLRRKSIDKKSILDYNTFSHRFDAKYKSKYMREHKRSVYVEKKSKKVVEDKTFYTRFRGFIRLIGDYENGISEGDVIIFSASGYGAGNMSLGAIIRQSSCKMYHEGNLIRDFIPWVECVNLAKDYIRHGYDVDYSSCTYFVEYKDENIRRPYSAKTYNPLK